MRNLLFASAAAVALAAGAASGATVVQVVFSRAPSSPTSDVPGAVDATGTPVTAKFNAMENLWLSPNGARFILTGSTTQPSTESAYVLVGSGTTGSVVLQEARPFPGAVGAEVLDFISGFPGYPFNAAGDWAIAIRARGGSASTFNKILRYQGTTGALRFQMGGLYTDVMDVPANPSGDETIGNSTASVHLLNDGRIGWDDLATLNIHTSVRPVLAYDAVGYFQRLDTVTTLDGAGTLAVTNIGAPSTITVFLTSPDGTRTVIRGEADVDGNLASSPEDPDVVIVDGRVRIQVGQPIPGTAITPTGISQTFVAANNDWYARGSVTTPASAWAVRNGSLLAKTGDPIGADTWATTFNALTGNSNGDWAMIGKTSNANPAIDDVLAVNGQVVLREGDPIPFDIDNNGTLDTAYIGRGVNTNAAFASIHSLGLAADGTIYVLAYLHDAGGIDLAASGTPVALLRITQTPDCPADFNDSGAVTVQDIFDFLAAYFTQNPSADFNNSGGVTVQDIFDFLGAYFTGCP